MRAVSCRRTSTESRKARRPVAVAASDLEAARQRIEWATCDIVARDFDRAAHVERVLEDVYTLKARHWERTHAA